MASALCHDAVAAVSGYLEFAEPGSNVDGRELRPSLQSASLRDPSLQRLAWAARRGTFNLGPLAGSRTASRIRARNIVSNGPFKTGGIG